MINEAKDSIAKEREAMAQLVKVNVVDVSKETVHLSSVNGNDYIEMPLSCLGLYNPVEGTS